MIRGFVGVIHLPPMPGDPAHRGPGRFAQVLDHALRDADALAQGGVDGIIVENFGSAPFPKGNAADRLPPHQVAAITCVASACMARFDVPIGVNCLRNDAISALGIAAATGAAFVRVNVHSGAYVTDQGIIEGEAYHSVRYRRALDADHVAILADVLVKHAQPLTPVDATTAIHDTLLRGMADGIVVTGAATGSPVSLELLEEAREAVGSAPLLIGSGLNPENAATLAPLCDGAIVGTWLKEDGVLSRHVSPDRVRHMADTLHPLLRRRD